MGFGRGASYVQALEQAEKGISDPTNIKRMLGQVKREYSGTENQMLALHRLSGGKLKLHQTRSLLGMDAGALSSENIQAIMANQQANIGQDARNSRRGMGLHRMQIAKSQKRAQVAASALPAINAMFEAQMAGMNTAIAGFNALPKPIKNVVKNMKQLNKEVHELGGVFNTVKAIIKGSIMFEQDKAKRIKPETKVAPHDAIPQRFGKDFY